MAEKYDIDEIYSAIEQKLLPVFEHLGKILAEIKADAQVGVQLRDGFKDMTYSHRRGELSSQLAETFGPDLEALDTFYSDVKGQKYGDMLLDELMDNEGNIEDQNEWLGGKISGEKEKYGKYLGFNPASEEEEESEDEYEEMTPEEFMAQEEHEEGETPEEETEENEDEEEDPVKKMMGLMSLK